RPARRAHAACRKPLWGQHPPHRRILLQGPGAGPEGGDPTRPAPWCRCSFHQGQPLIGPMQVALIDYGSGNLRSAARALLRAAAEGAVQAEIRVTAEPDLVARADRIVLPGVGAFADCMAGLGAVPGLVPALTEAVRVRGRPFLGICVGMQLLAERGLEHGEHPGLGWISGEVRQLKPADPALKVPQTGWNELNLRRPEHPLLAGVGEGAHAFFLHPCHLCRGDPRNLLAEVDYGGSVWAMVAEGSVAGTQFHPEKSQAVGLRLLANFLKWRP